MTKKQQRQHLTTTTTTTTTITTTITTTTTIITRTAITTATTNMNNNNNNNNSNNFLSIIRKSFVKRLLNIGLDDPSMKRISSPGSELLSRGAEERLRSYLRNGRQVPCLMNMSCHAKVVFFV